MNHEVEIYFWVYLDDDFHQSGGQNPPKNKKIIFCKSFQDFEEEISYVTKTKDFLYLSKR